MKNVKFRGFGNILQILAIAFDLSLRKKRAKMIGKEKQYVVLGRFWISKNNYSFGRGLFALAFDDLFENGH